MTKLSKATILVMLAVTAAFPAEAFEPTMDIFIENPLQPIFHGATNLRDGSELMLTLSRPESGYMAQAKMRVVAGHFTTEQFTSAGRPLNPGRYKVEVSMSMAQLQPKNVQVFIGDRGQRMTGKFVIRSSLGGGQEFRYRGQRMTGKFVIRSSLGGGQEFRYRGQRMTGKFVIRSSLGGGQEFRYRGQRMTGKFVIPR